MGDLVQFIPRDVNGVTVEQRDTDGFINGTAMCTAYDKDIVDWFRTTRTFNLFRSLAGDLGIKSNMVLHHDSDISRLSATKYAEMFPGLLHVKRGSPKNGGGVWVHPDVSIDLASECNPLFGIQVARWVREWFATGKNPVQAEPDLDKEYIAWQERYDIRIDLKDNLRPELMEATRAYAVANGISPITLCSRVHDIMNERIQGAKSKDIKAFHKLSLYTLLRDYFNVEYLHKYAAINHLAINAIIDEGVSPIEAVHKACDRYLGLRYVPKLISKTENVHSQGHRLKQAKQIKLLQPYQQLSLFDNGEVV